jgi:hypothetical protein
MEFGAHHAELLEHRAARWRRAHLLLRALTWRGLVLNLLS